MSGEAKKVHYANAIVGGKPAVIRFSDADFEKLRALVVRRPSFWRRILRAIYNFITKEKGK